MLPAKQPDLSDIEEENDDGYSTPTAPTPPPRAANVETSPTTGFPSELTAATRASIEAYREERAIPAPNVAELSTEDRVDRLYQQMNMLVNFFNQNHMRFITMYRILRDQEEANKRIRENEKNHGRDRDENDGGDDDGHGDGDGGWENLGRMERG